MGWQNMHLHGFRRTDTSGHAEIWWHEPEMFDSGLPGGPTVHKEATATVTGSLPETGARATYDYDFGDSWEHTLTRLGDEDGGPRSGR